MTILVPTWTMSTTDLMILEMEIYLENQWVFPSMKKFQNTPDIYFQMKLVLIDLGKEFAISTLNIVWSKTNQNMQFLQSDGCRMETRSLLDMQTVKSMFGMALRWNMTTVSMKFIEIESMWWNGSKIVNGYWLEIRKVRLCFGMTNSLACIIWKFMKMLFEILISHRLGVTLSLVLTIDTSKCLTLLDVKKFINLISIDLT